VNTPLQKFSLFLALLSVWMATPGCACFKAENANTKACVVLHQEIDCATDNVKALAPHLLPLVQWLFSGATGPLNTDDIIAALEHMGFQFIGCSATELDHDFVTTPQLAMAKLMRYVPPEATANTNTSVNPLAMAQTYHGLYARWRSRHLDVKFCFQENGRKVCR
jgi:hypothetical protein